jgi:hypothetical protein
MSANLTNHTNGPSIGTSAAAVGRGLDDFVHGYPRTNTDRLDCGIPRWMTL